MVTIGNFDGVHAGHAALVRRSREEAGDSGRVVVLAFEPHPRSVLAPDSEPPRLTTFEHRADLLRDLGADDVLALDPRSGLLGLSPQAFIDHVCQDFAPSVIVEGDDFRFGKTRAGGMVEMADLGRARGFRVVTVGPVEVDLDDQTIRRAGSSLVRDLLRAGRVRDAARVLGRRYRVSGEVVPGDRLGRTIGFPTANLVAETMLPADGVYGALAVLPSGERLPAAVNVGARPTVRGAERRLEAHVLGGPLEDLPEYGYRLAIELDSWVRDQIRFESIDALAAQLARDCARIGAQLAESEPQETTA